MKSTAKTVWQSLIRRKPMEDVLDERRTVNVRHSEKKEAVEQLERV